MPDDTDQQRQVLADQAWRAMFGFFMRTRPQRDEVLGRLGLTPTEAKALHSVHTSPGRTLKELAAEWRCDASTATWTVDRLERLGLAERRPHPRDRRAKLVVLTDAGAGTKARLQAGMNATPPELLQLDATDLRTLRDLLGKLPADEATDTFADPGSGRRPAS
jgi:MarR family transcriptional regulator, organic hydroperoxide resistance regulator